MDKIALQKLIAAKIAGQGTMVDAGGALPEILSALAGAAPIEVTDITKLTAEQLDALNVGDKVVKVTGVQKHLYLVSYKGELNISEITATVLPSSFLIIPSPLYTYKFLFIGQLFRYIFLIYYLLFLPINSP